jgi:hypothetical protein
MNAAVFDMMWLTTDVNLVVVSSIKMDTAWSYLVNDEYGK